MEYTSGLRITYTPVNSWLLHATHSTTVQTTSIVNTRRIAAVGSKFPLCSSTKMSLAVSVLFETTVVVYSKLYCTCKRLQHNASRTYRTRILNSEPYSPFLKCRFFKTFLSRLKKESRRLLRSSRRQACDFNRCVSTTHSSKLSSYFIWGLCWYVSGCMLSARSSRSLVIGESTEGLDGLLYSCVCYSI